MSVLYGFALSEAVTQGATLSASLGQAGPSHRGSCSGACLLVIQQTLADFPGSALEGPQVLAERQPRKKPQLQHRCAQDPQGWGRGGFQVSEASEGGNSGRRQTGVEVTAWRRR